MSVARIGLALLATTLVTTPLFVSPATAQQRPELPDNVKEWLARDQPRRWAAMIEAGEKLFSEGICAQCHGQGGTSGRFGPDLTDQEWVQSDGSLDGIRMTLLWGVRKQDLSDAGRPFMLPDGGMELSSADRNALVAYVWSLANGTFLPER